MSKKVNGMIADNPKLMAFFDAENNPGIDPHQLSAGSAKKINWKCRKCGYKFERSVRKFLARPECPCCEIGSVVVRGINDVFTLVPQLKASYDFEKNKDIDIYSLSPASRIPVYWKCPDCGKESFSAIASRVRKQKDGTYHVAGCQNCSVIKSRKRKYGKPVYLSDDPETLRFYDRENNTIRPEGLSIHSSLPRNWKCPDCGYKWVATVKNMCKIKNKCPACREVNKQKLKEHPAGKRDLFTVVPEARRYYDFEANGDYDISNHYYRDNKKQLYWKCPDCGYSWKSTSLVHLYKKDGKWRWKGGCMRCAKKGKKYFKESVASKEFLMDIWDEEKNEVAPESISAYSDQSAFWNCRKCGYKWQRTIRKTTNSNGRCPHCEDKTEVMRGVDDVLTVVPDLEQFIDKSYDYSDIYRADVTSGIHIHWECPKCGRKWESEIRHRLKKYEDGTYGVIGCTSCGYMSERNYAERYPDVAAMYDKKRNKVPMSYIHGEKMINDYYYWNCPDCGEGYQAILLSVLRAIRETGKPPCPYCTGKKPRKGESFADVHPDLMEEFDPENTVDPYEYFPDVHTNVGWICKNDPTHKWVATFAARHNGRGQCPVCSRLYVIKGINSFADVFPQYVHLWSSENSLGPDEILFDSRTPYLWNCDDCGQNFSASTIAISRWKGCPYCNGKKLLKEFNSVAVKFPELAARWSDENEQKADEVLPSIKASYYLDCNKCGGTYLAPLQKAIAGEDECPYCSGRRLLRGYNSLADRHPDIVASYSKRNKETADEVLSTSNKFIYWDCNECGGTYMAPLQGKINGTVTCPYCSGKQLLQGYNSVAVKCPDVAARWSDQNEKTADEVLYTSSGSYYLDCRECGEPYLTRLQFAIEGIDECPYCSGKKLLPGYNSVAVKYPDIAKRWSDKNEKTADEVLYTSPGSYYLNCTKCGEPYLTGLQFAIKGKDDCPYCSGRKLLIGYNSVAVKYPDIAARWSDQNEKTADEVLYTSSGSYYLDCRECGEVYLARLQFAIEGKDGCPYCSGKKLLPGYNSVAVKYPDIAKRWSDKNEKTADEVLPTDRGSYYLNCPECGGTYPTKLQEAIAGEDECPYCSGRKLLPGYNSFDVKHPDLMEEWDYRANYVLADPKQIKDTCTTRVWWICRKNQDHVYPMTVKNRVMYEKRGREACPYCKGRRRKLSHFMPKPKFDNEWDD